MTISHEEAKRADMLREIFERDFLYSQRPSDMGTSFLNALKIGSVEFDLLHGYAHSKADAFKYRYNNYDQVIEFGDYSYEKLCLIEDCLWLTIANEMDLMLDRNINIEEPGFDYFSVALKAVSNLKKAQYEQYVSQYAETGDLDTFTQLGYSRQAWNRISENTK